jgi:bifunctional non-homologous end joining protein LigD
VSSLGAQSVTIDGEAVCCGPDGMPDFDLLHGGQNDGAVFLQAFDLIEQDGADLRDRPLEERKAKLAGLLRGVAASGWSSYQHDLEIGRQLATRYV